MSNAEKGKRAYLRQAGIKRVKGEEAMRKPLPDTLWCDGQGNWWGRWHTKEP